MFMLYALAVGLVVGLIGGGRLEGVGALRIAWAPVLVAGLLAQVALFSDPVAARVGDVGPVLYIASTLVVDVAIVRNLGIPGMPVVAIGAACNLVAIVANGGYMPASPAALAALQRAEATVYSNSTVVAEPVLPWLTDVFALPGWVPGTDVFSVGDVLISVGIATVIALAMRRAARAAAGAPAH
jgi:hypothetical protein